MEKLLSRRQLLILSCPVMTVMAGCNFWDADSENSSQQTLTVSRNSTGESNEENGADGNIRNTETPAEPIYNEQTDTGNLVLNTFQLPDDFSYLDESLWITKDLSEDHPEYDWLIENNIIRQHTNQFVNEINEGSTILVNSTVFICKSIPAAKELKKSRIESFISDPGQRTAVKDGHTIPTTRIKIEDQSDTPLSGYIGRDRNAVLELVVTGTADEISTENLYIQMESSLID